MSQDGRNVRLVVVVWGSWHIAKFLEFGLPSLLALGNIPAVAKDRKVIFDIVTSEADRFRFSNHPALDRLGEFADIRIHAVSTPPSTIASTFMFSGWCHFQAVSRDDGCFLVVLHPENIYANTTLPRALQKLLHGESAFFVRGTVRCISETLEPLLAKLRQADAHGAIDLGGAHLVKLGLQHLHSYNASLIEGNVVGRRAFETHFRTAETVFNYVDTSYEAMAFDPSIVELTPFFDPFSASKSVDIGTRFEEAFAVSLTPFHYTWNYLSAFRTPDTVREIARMSALPLIVETPDFTYRRRVFSSRSIGSASADIPLQRDGAVAGFEDALYLHQRFQLLLRVANKIDPTLGRILALSYFTGVIDGWLRGLDVETKLVLRFSPQILSRISERNTADTIDAPFICDVSNECLGKGVKRADIFTAQMMSGASLSREIRDPQRYNTLTQIDANSSAIESRFGDLILIER